MGSSAIESYASGLENSFIDYAYEDQDYVQLRFESPAENGVTIERDYTMTSETVNSFHIWNLYNPNFGGNSVINIIS